jgi:tetratricopeptide (TPR) repeat protein
VDLQRLETHQRFEELCRQLLLILYPDLNVVDGRGGDEGTDSFIGSIHNQECIFQFKYFPKRLDRNHWSKIKKSLKSSFLKEPQKWVLLTSAELTVPDRKRWDEMKQQYSNIELNVWDGAMLEHLILQNQSVLALEFQELFPPTEIARKLFHLMAEHSPIPFTASHEQIDLPILKRYEEKSLTQLSEIELQRLMPSVKKFKQLFVSLGSALKIEETNVKFLSKLGLYCYNTENYEEACFIFGLILREYPDDLRSLNNKAASLHETKDVEALGLLDSALLIFHDFFDAKVNKGVILIESDQPLRGIEILESMYIQKPENQTNESILQGLVQGYAKLGNLEKVLYYYDKAKSLSIDHDLLTSNLGFGYLNTGRVYEAFECFDSLFKSNPCNEGAELNRTAALIECGFYRWSALLLERIVTRGPCNMFALTNLALAYYKQDKPDLAILCGEKANALNEKNYDYCSL